MEVIRRKVNDMNHKNNYLKVLNTLSGVETKGESTIAVANCLRFLAQCINACDAETAQKAAEAEKKEGEENHEDNEGDNSNC